MTQSGALIFNSMFPIALAMAGALFSVYTDVRWGLIKNFITLPLIIIGWLWSFLAGGVLVLLTNILVSIVVGILSTRAGCLGEGDIKLIVGISACLQPMLSLLFLAFFYVVLLLSAVLVRFKANNYSFRQTLSAIKNEIMMDLGGVKDANFVVHGEKVKHLGAPVILFALILCLVQAKAGGLI